MFFLAEQGEVHVFRFKAFLFALASRRATSTKGASELRSQVLGFAFSLDAFVLPWPKSPSFQYSQGVKELKEPHLVSHQFQWLLPLREPIKLKSLP